MSATKQHSVLWPLLFAAGVGLGACTSEPEAPCYFTDEGVCVSRVESVWCRTWPADLADVQRACWIEGAATACAEPDFAGLPIDACYERPRGDGTSDVIHAWTVFPSRVGEREALRPCSAELWAEVQPWPLCPTGP